MTNVNELRQRIAEIEVPKSFLKSLKRDYGHQPIKKTSIGNLPKDQLWLYPMGVLGFPV